MQLNDEQKKVLHSVIENPQGLYIITSTFGSGKMFFIKYITQHL
jgi:type II secretory ATPase GspE/PulE/Tfp pilus assembly ATPase PilB-like protein